MPDQPSNRANHLGQPIGDMLAGWVPPPLPARVAMVGRYCRVEPLDVNRHAADLWEAYAVDETERNWTYLMHGPYATYEQYVAWAQRSAESQDPLFFAVVSETPLRATGVAAYLRIAPEAGSIEVGHINFSLLLQRTRAATESMYLMMKQAFELGYRRYEWKCDALNAPSRAAVQRLGLSFEGVFRQATVYKGRNRDSAWYAAIDREWPDLKNAFEQWLDPANFEDDDSQRVRLSELTASILVSRG